ncbi:uncharacterized protein PG986_014526 [Apiospora aurea]|uniref:Fe2OG dioxygenase domain-containing protein n=1 Tax=Apiospora aurea TaxID=335848 RepID=A0ABR1PTJ8_9PEZI
MPATLETINYEAILNKDAREASMLREACKPPPAGKGIFYLDLTGPSGKQILLALPKVDQGILAYFGQPVETKMNDYREGVERGFKHPGEVIETFEINYNETVDASRGLPPGLQGCKGEIASVLASGHLIATTLLAALHPSTTQAPGAGRPSDSGLKLYLQDADAARVPAQSVTAAPHTDMGLLTLLSYDVPYLELAETVKPPASSTGNGGEGGGKKEAVMGWAPVEPKGGCVVVHVGDALQAGSRGALHSPLHRVVQPESPPAGGVCMVVYFLRPEHQQGEPKAA